MILALLTGATIINEELGDDMDLIQVEHLGTCLKSVTNHMQKLVIQIENIPERSRLMMLVKTLIKDH